MCLSPAGKKKGSLFEQIGSGDFNRRSVPAKNSFLLDFLFDRGNSSRLLTQTKHGLFFPSNEKSNRSIKANRGAAGGGGAACGAHCLPAPPSCSLFEQVWPCVSVNRYVWDKLQVSYCSGHILRPEARCNSISVGLGSSSAAAASHPPPPPLLSPSTPSCFVLWLPFIASAPEGGTFRKDNRPGFQGQAGSGRRERRKRRGRKKRVCCFSWELKIMFGLRLVIYSVSMWDKMTTERNVYIQALLEPQDINLTRQTRHFQQYQVDLFHVSVV